MIVTLAIYADEYRGQGIPRVASTVDGFIAGPDGADPRARTVSSRPPRTTCSISPLNIQRAFPPRPGLR